MASQKAQAMAEQAARDKQQATLDEILGRVKSLEAEVKALREEIAKKPESKFSEASRNVASQIKPPTGKK